MARDKHTWTPYSLDAGKSICVLIHMYDG